MSKLRYSLKFSDSKLQLLASACSEVQLPIQTARLRLSFIDNKNVDVRSILKSVQSKTIDSLVVTIYGDKNTVFGTYTFTKIKLVPVSIVIGDELDKAANYMVEITAEATNIVGGF